MAKVKVRVLGAVVGGHKRGSVISVEEKAVKHLEENRYVERVAANTKESGKDDSKDGE